MQAGGGKATQARYPITLLWGEYGLVPDQRQNLTTVGGVPILGTENHIQQQRLDDGLPQPTGSSEEVGDGSEGPRKDGSNVSGPGSNVQGGGAVSVTLWKLELGGDQRYAQVPDVIPP